MSKKREQRNRRREVAKARKGVSRTPARKAPAPVRTEEKGSQAMDIWIAVGIVLLVVGALVALWYFGVRRPQEKAAITTIAVETPVAIGPPSVMQWPEPPAMTIDTSRDYEAVLRTAKGDIRIQLYDDLVPLTVNNFVFLARQGYYDGVTFHRVISGFMAQSGDPTGTGSGGPGYQFADEFNPLLRHDSEGIVSMANAGANTNGSQFFITYAPQPHLDDMHSVFGKVIDGMDVVRTLTPRDPEAGGPAGDVINTVEIIEN
jgi:cyclophilin family peptidyl-prolyl cis-trans isomerase